MVKKAVKLRVVLLIIINSCLISFNSLSQSIDTSKIIRVIEKELRKQGLPNAKFQLSVKSTNQSGGQTAFEISNYYGSNSHVVNGVNNGINGDINLVSEKYSVMAQWDIYGLPFVSNGSITVESETSLLMKKTIHQEDSVISVILSDESLSCANQVIVKNPYFPFAYWVKAIILKSRNNIEWVISAEKGVEILRNTTQVMGHNQIHDKVLEKLNSLLQEYYQSKR